MKPAKQRSVGPMIAKLEKPANARAGEKENVPSSEAEVARPSTETREASTSTKRSVTRRGSLGSSVPSSPNARRGSVSASRQRSPCARGGSIGAGATYTLVRKNSSVKQDSRPSNRLPMTQSSSQPPSMNQQSQDSSKHPLLSRTGKAPQLKVAWSSFPEEPNYSQFMNLKRSWSAVLPGTSTAKLFPPGGIKKQDDAKEGCELLERAIDMDSEAGTSDLIESHIDYLLKWISYVLCCKEATVGLQSILSLIRRLFEFLLQCSRFLSEDEVGVLVPFLLEKTSNAKGRFRDSFMDIVGQLHSEILVSPKILGPVVCVQVIERSKNSKARALAFSICRDCVVTVGLPGIGKKGVVASAKSLSEEQIPDTKSAALDLMEEVLRRMNGDINKVAKICGSALSEKAQDSIEQRWKKSGSRKELLPPTSSVVRKPTESTLPVSPEPTIGKIAHETPGSERSATLQDELPSFNLRNMVLDADDRPRRVGGPEDDAVNFRTKAPDNEDRFCPVDEPNGYTDDFPVSLPTRSTQGDDLGPLHTEQLEVSSLEQIRTCALMDPVETARACTPYDSTDLESIRSTTTTQTSGTLGTAASLRARLLKIKEKNRAPDTDRHNAQAEKDFDDVTTISTQGDGRDEYKIVLSHIKALTRRSRPLREDDVDILTTTRSLKKVHTALANTADSNIDGITSLKSVLVENLSGLITELIR